MYSPYLLLFLIGTSLSFTTVSAADEANDTQNLVSNVTSTPLPPPAPSPTPNSRQARILNGVESNERDYRYQVAVMHLRKDVPVLVCGGAIIHRRYVLTAAHCVHKYRSFELVVRSGGVQGPHPYTPQKEERSFHRVVKTMLLKQYSSVPCRKHQHDIAILKVQQVFDLANDERYRKVNLPEEDADYEHAFAIVGGYGVDYSPNQNVTQPPGLENYYLQYVDKLRTMPTIVMSNEECQELAKVVVTEGTICTRAMNATMQTCFEDNGGPLVHRGTVIGILNERNCNNQEPELFTRVSSYLHFIRNVLQHKISYDIVIR